MKSRGQGNEKVTPPRHCRSAFQTFAGHEDKIFEDFLGKTELVLSEWDDVKPGDKIAVAVHFFTEEVKLDEGEYLRGGLSWTIGSECRSDWTGVQT